MPIEYRFDVLEALKAKGYTTYKLRKEKLLAESTIQKFRRGAPTVTLDNIEAVCKMLDCQPGDLLIYTKSSACCADDTAPEAVPDKPSQE